MNVRIFAALLVLISNSVPLRAVEKWNPAYRPSAENLKRDRTHGIVYPSRVPSGAMRGQGPIKPQKAALEPNRSKPPKRGGARTPLKINRGSNVALGGHVFGERRAQTPNMGGALRRTIHSQGPLPPRFKSHMPKALKAEPELFSDIQQHPRRTAAPRNR